MDLPTQKGPLAHTLRKLALVWAPVLIATAALALRLYGIDWDQEHLFHPDERAILFHVNDMHWPSPSNWTVVFDAEKSPLNPQWFPYGSLPMYTAKLAQAAISPIKDLTFHDLRFVGRGLSALSDVGTVIFVFLLATRLYSRRVGILASLLAALAVVHIQLSHFYAVDTYLTFFILASAYFMARVLQEGRLRNSLLAGAFIGLALASKISVAPIFLAFVVAHGIRYTYSRRGSDPSSSRPSVPLLAVTARNLALGGMAALLLFFLTTPYAFLDWSRLNPCQVPFSFLSFLDNNYFACDVGAQYNMARGTSGLPFTQQYIDTTPYWYHIRQLALFGLGLPLGIVAWASVAFTVVLAVARRNAGDLLILAWVLPYFLLTGYLQVKFLRYMLPITPFLIIMGARMLFWIRDWVVEHRPHQAVLVHWGMGFLVVATGFYALSYLNIYSQPHTAVRASSWINENVPRGSILLREHWEEELPSLTGYGLGCGNQWEAQSCMKMYDPDDARYEGGKDKMTRVAEQLAGADYLVFFSNRLYGSIPRVPDRYPQSGDYYRKLFAGELGYRLEHLEATYPKLLGVAFVDDTFSSPGLPTPAALGPYRPAPLAINLGYADESFSVYDHPKVLIFKNQDRLSAAELAARLLQSVGEPEVQKTLLLIDADLAAQREGGTWTAIFDPDSLVNRFPAAVWLLLIEGLAILTLPLSLFIFRVLPDRGYLLAKPLGLLLTAYVAWLLASLHWMPFSRSSILVAAFLVAGVSLLIVYSRRVDLFAFFRENLRLVVIGEAIFLISFLAFLLLRAANPDLWHPYNGGEKPMEMAYLNAVLRSTYMPPYDPWFAGGYINYYYFGQFIVASLVRVTGILPEVAFNLAVPLFFALTTTAVFSLVYNLAEGTRRSHTGSRRLPSPVLAGLAAVFFVAVMGNLDGITQVGEGLARVWVHDQSFGSFDFWRSSRAIPSGDPRGHEITEFPFFTFLFADLHAHMMAIPFTLLSVGMALTVALRLRDGAGIVARFAYLLILALAVGSLRAINTWDFPTYMALGAAAIVIGEYAHSRHINISMQMRVVLQVALLFWLTTLLFQPYVDSYQSFTDGVFTSQWQTPLYGYLGIHGLFIFVALTFLVYRARSYLPPFLRAIIGHESDEGVKAVSVMLARDSGKALRITLAIGLLLATIITLVASGYTTVAFLSVIGALTALLAWQWMQSREEMPYGVFALALLSMALALGIGVEVVTIKGDIARMNTVFKFYLQAWVLLGMATAYLLWRMEFGKAILRGVSASLVGRAFGGVWMVLLLALLLGSSVYTVAGTQARLRDRFQVLPLTLNGLALMDTARYTFDRGQGSEELRWDYDAILWLRGKDVVGSPVVLEGQGELYRTLHGRVSMYTGLPTVLGWDNHQSQQRGYGPVIGERIGDIRRIYSTTNRQEASELLNKYKVQYVYVGELERHFYPKQGLDKFDSMVGMELAYTNPGVQIHQVLSEDICLE